MEIIIKNKKHGNQIMLIDNEDYEKIKDLNLTLNTNSNKHTFYCKSNIYKVVKILEPTEKRPNTTRKIFKLDKKIHIHRLIMGLGDYKDDKRIINHKNNNGLDNRKENLEICDTMYNSQSKNKRFDYKNIYYDLHDKRKKRWRVYITLNKKKYSKRFLTEEEAKNYLETLKI